jgi:alpha-D-ribose 1-methylphosphonate 5-phosphate C-P lyase
MIETQKFQKSFNYAFIDEFTKKEIRRKTLKAVCIPGYQVPYSSPEMPISRGWGTGGLHLSLSLIGPDDVFKVIDQGSDASVSRATAYPRRSLPKSRSSSCRCRSLSHSAASSATKPRPG